MKNGFFFLIGIMALTGLVGCNGGGGSGGGSSNSPTGSARFENLASGSGATYCIKNNAIFSNYSAPSDQFSCASAGGSWNTNPSVSIPDKCRINGIDYSVIGGGSATSFHISACTNAGGSFVASSTVSQSYCSGHTPLTCVQAGGTEVWGNAITGDIDPSTDNLVAGSNTISVDTDLYTVMTGCDFVLGSSNCVADPNTNEVYANLTTQSPKVFKITSIITFGGLGNRFWTSEIIKPTSPYFSGAIGYASDTPSFSVSLPVGTSTDLIAENPILYWSL